MYLICQETVAVYKEFNVKRRYQTKHANAYDKLSGSDCAEKVTQLEAQYGLPSVSVPYESIQTKSSVAVSSIPFLLRFLKV